jgi:hypothetical protein
MNDDRQERPKSIDAPDLHDEPHWVGPLDDDTARPVKAELHLLRRQAVFYALAWVALAVVAVLAWVLW